MNIFFKNWRKFHWDTFDRYGCKIKKKISTPDEFCLKDSCVPCIKGETVMALHCRLFHFFMVYNEDVPSWRFWNDSLGWEHQNLRYTLKSFLQHYYRVIMVKNDIKVIKSNAAKFWSLKEKAWTFHCVFFLFCFIIYYTNTVLYII